MRRPVHQTTYGILAGALGLVMATVAAASSGPQVRSFALERGSPTGDLGLGAPNPSRGEPPVLPVGLDAYRQWERWPYQRLGVRAYMRSTYDRRGGNEGADASHFLYQPADDFNVSLDVGGSRRPLFRPLQSLARQPVALRGGRRGPSRSRDRHRRSG